MKIAAYLIMLQVSNIDTLLTYYRNWFVAQNDTDLRAGDVSSFDSTTIALFDTLASKGNEHLAGTQAVRNMMNALYSKNYFTEAQLPDAAPEARRGRPENEPFVAVVGGFTNNIYFGGMQFEHYPQFFTATILEWKPLLQHDVCKRIVMDSMQFLVADKRVFIYGFVIMPNHVHLIWQVRDGHTVSKVQQSFLRYTAQKMKFYLQERDPVLLEQFRVNAADREFQFWERNALSVDLYTDKVFEQKLNYIHENPIQPKWKLCTYAEEYRWSSAAFYYRGDRSFGFLTHCDGE